MKTLLFILILICYSCAKEIQIKDALQFSLSYECGMQDTTTHESLNFGNTIELNKIYNIVLIETDEQQKNYFNNKPDSNTIYLPINLMKQYKDNIKIIFLIN